MQTYIALLRGINVGGKNKVSMALLKTAFEELGFTEVRTYINSGNVIFKSEPSDKIELINLCEKVIAKHFGLAIPVCIISAAELADALSHSPDWWDTDCDVEMIHQAIFLIPPMTAAEAIKAVGEVNDITEKVSHHQNVIFWSAAKATFGKTRWSKISGKSVYNKVTIRNANTSKKLLALSK